jgi:cyclophilin family peptidyl-prolyl cis-trans isomerase
MRDALAIVALAVGSAAHPDDFRVRFDVETTAGAQSFTLKVNAEWAPMYAQRLEHTTGRESASLKVAWTVPRVGSGAARFRELVKAKFYDDTRFFRVIPTFMVQFGLSGEAASNSHWRAKTIKDEPVKVSNKPGYITFAKTGAPNSRTTQLFFNYVDNARLDGMGFAPFGEVEGSGMDIVKQIFNWCARPPHGEPAGALHALRRPMCSFCCRCSGEKPNQGSIQSEGNTYLDKSFPKLSKIVRVVEIADSVEANPKVDL